MATVPTLMVGSVDQTDFIQDKTLGFRLKYLDFTLVDPVTDPILHNAVSLDEPEWHGRVSTIESHPWRAANGDDHRWVKVTATNKHTGDNIAAPFDLSDAPDYSTTFPYKDLGVIRTLEDQTDLATAELRMTGICYEPGLMPGMTVHVTSDAELLADEPVFVVEMSVNWLRDDAPEFHFELSDTNTPLPGLGDLIDSQGCDCVPFVPCEEDHTVRSFANADNLACVVASHGPSGSCESTDYMILYEGATYRLDYLVFHAVDSNQLSVSLALLSGAGFGSPGPGVGNGDPPAIYMGDHARHCQFGVADDIPAASTEWTVPYSGGVGYIECTTILTESSCTAGDTFASSVSVTATWLSGPDPRFTDSECTDDLPHSGQALPVHEFTGDGANDGFSLPYPYMAGTLVVLVEGVDWSDQVTEVDATVGDFALAYPPPLATDGEPNVEVHYRYP